MRKSLLKKDNIWWNSELASLRKEARRAWRKAIETKQKDCKAQKLGLAFFKKGVRRAKRDSWHCFVERTSSQTPTSQLVKIIRRNETVPVSNVIKHNGELTKSPLKTLNNLLDILSPGSQQTENHAIGSDLVDNPFMRPEDTEMIANQGCGSAYFPTASASASTSIASASTASASTTFTKIYHNIFS